MIETNLAKILDLFCTNLDSINSRTAPIKKFKEELVEENILMEVSQQNSESYESQHEFVVLTSNDFNEK